MKRGITFLFLVISLFMLLSAAQAEEETREGLLLHMSKGEDHAHEVLMPLSLGLKMHEAKAVQFFLDIDAVNLVKKGAEPVSFRGFDHASNILIERLLAAGVGIHVCPMCMKAAGMTEDDLIEGVVVAGPDTFHGFTSGRIVTLDW